MAVIEHPQRTTRHAGSERAARADLRAQIGSLERRLAHLATATYPRLVPAAAAAPRMAAGPRVLDLGELEQLRDALAARLTAVQAAAAEQAARQAEAREELALMLADPPGHRGRRLTNTELGLPGCTTYEVRPRLGLIGMLASWWHVKISSGCPLCRRP